MKYIIEWSWSSLPSKKNSKQLRRSWKTEKNFISSSDEYHEWEEKFILEVKSLWYTLGKVKSAMFTFFAPNKRKFDLTNKAESLNDWLVKAGFLEDDDYEHIPEITLKFWGFSKNKEWEVKMEFEK